MLCCAPVGSQNLLLKMLLVAYNINTSSNLLFCLEQQPKSWPNCSVEWKNVLSVLSVLYGTCFPSWQNFKKIPRSCCMVTRRRMITVWASSWRCKVRLFTLVTLQPWFAHTYRNHASNVLHQSCRERGKHSTQLKICVLKYSIPPKKRCTSTGESMFGILNF